MRFISLAAAALAATPAIAAAQAASGAAVQVGVFAYDASEAVVASAWDTAPSASALVFSNASACQVGAGAREAPADAREAWRFTTRILNITPQAAVIHLDWQRVLEHGKPVTTPSGSVQLALGLGDKVLLDRGSTDPGSQCHARHMTFEARYGTHPMRTVAIPPAAGATARGNGRGASTVDGAGGYDADMWLVRSVPGRPDDVRHHRAAATKSGTTFTLDSMTTDAAGGSRTVRVGVSLAVVERATGDQLMVTLERRISSSTRMPRDVPQGAHGISRVAVDIPSPEEVLSFEMPPIRIDGQRELPDRFSIRLQLRPK
jgi:hypothetical protein